MGGGCDLTPHRRGLGVIRCAPSFSPQNSPSSESASGSPGLSGTRYLGWFASVTLAVLSLAIVYHLLRQSHSPSIVLAVVIALSWVCILSGHRFFHRPSPNERVPEVRFGTTAGWFVGFLLYLLFAFTVLQ